MPVLATVSLLQAIGAGCFGAVIGWFTYHVNRYRTGGVRLMDISTLIGIVGGGAILTLFPEKTDLFAAYGAGLAVVFSATSWCCWRSSSTRRTSRWTGSSTDASPV
jgi:hypothetical protein